MNCTDCKFSFSTEIDKSLNRQMVCRRYPPTAGWLNHNGQLAAFTLFPQVSNETLCGEFAAKKPALDK